MTDESIFAEALAIGSPADRAAYLDRACAGNPALRADVQALLDAHAASNPLDQPPVDVARTGAYAPERAESPDEAVGSVLAGKYKLVEVIGAGGMGAVYMAQQTEPVKRLVAVKVIRDGMDTRQVLARFEAERQALALMDHPNIAKVLDAGTTDRGRPFFVMELVKGVPITEFCDARKLSPRVRLELFVPVCQAIQHAHQKGVIHRDIKPSNVLVALYDGKPVPKVIDFGVAKAAGQPLTDMTLVTGFGAIVGTPEYMSPEQAELNQLDIDTRSDVFALGVLLYELLTGSTPLNRTQLGKAALLEVLRIVREVEPPKPSTRVSTSDARASIAANRNTDPVKLSKLMKGELDWIVMKALEKDRNRRYESATALAKDVERHLRGDAVEACPPTFGYRLRKAYKRNRAAVLGGAAFALVLLVGIAGTSWGLVRALRAERSADKDARSARAAEEQAKAERDDKDKARAAEEALRVRVEAQYASQLLDLILADAQSEADDRRRLVALADALPRVSASARAARQFLTMAILAAGQYQHTLWDDVAEYDRKRLLVADPPLAVCLRRDNRVVFRSVPTGHLVRELPLEPSHWVSGLTLDESGKHLSVFAWTGTAHVVTVWSVATGAQLCARPADQDPVLSPDGKYLVTRHPFPSNRLFRGTDDVLLRVSDARTGAVRWQTVVAPREMRPGEDYYGFTRDGRAVVITGSRPESIISVRALDDGRVLLNPPGHRWRLTPSGRHLVVASLDDEVGELAVTWYRTTDWAKSGRAVVIERNDVSPTFPVFDQWALYDNFIVRPGGTAPVRATDGVETVLCFDEHRMLTSGGRVIEFDPARVHPRPVDKRYSPEARKLAPAGRFVASRSLIPHVSEHLELFELLDTEMERFVPLFPGYGSRGPHPAGDVLALTMLSELSDRRNQRVTHKRVVLLPTRELPISDDVLRLWARVIACGERGSDGRFVEWDEPTWDARRQELARTAPPVDGFPFPGSVASDRLHWVRYRVRSDTAGDLPDRLALLDRLVLAEPCVSALKARAEYHFYERNYSAALDDWERIDRLVRWGVQLPLEDILQRNLALTAQQWARLKRLLERGRGRVYWDARALVLYRSGHYQELVDRAARDKLGGLSGVGLAMTVPASPLMIFNSFLSHETGFGYTFRNDDEEGDIVVYRLAGEDPSPYLLAMSLYRLGRVAEARAVWDSLPERGKFASVLGDVDTEAAELTGWALPKRPVKPPLVNDRPRELAPPPREVPR